MKEWRPILVALVGALVLQGLFVGAFVAALSAPTPHDVPFGVVGPRSQTTPLIDAISKRTGSALDIRSYATDADVRHAIDKQDIFGAVEQTQSGRATLYVASAAGASVAKVFTKAAPTVAGNLGVKVTVKDLKPLPKTDPNGLTTFYVALGAVIYGFAGAMTVVGAAPQAPLRRLLPALAGFSLLGGCISGLVADPITGAISIDFVPFALIAALTMLTAAMITLFALRWLGQKAVPLVLIVLVILGSPSAGGAAAPDLLPGFFRFVGQWLPTGAATSALRNNVYFSGFQHGRPLFVLAGWLVLALAGVFALQRRRAHTLEAP
jgi:hypothetical protein